MRCAIQVDILFHFKITHLTTICTILQKIPILWAKFLQMIIQTIWRLHILLMKRLLKASYHIFPAFRLHSSSNPIPVRRRPPSDLHHHRPCILLALQIINILVHSRIYFRCSNNFYLDAFYIYFYFGIFLPRLCVCAALSLSLFINISVSLS